MRSPIARRPRMPRSRRYARQARSVGVCGRFSRRARAGGGGAGGSGPARRTLRHARARGRSARRQAIRAGDARGVSRGLRRKRPQRRARRTRHAAGDARAELRANRVLWNARFRAHAAVSQLSRSIRRPRARWSRSRAASPSKRRANGVTVNVVAPGDIREKELERAQAIAPRREKPARAPGKLRRRRGRRAILHRAGTRFRHGHRDRSHRRPANRRGIIPGQTYARLVSTASMASDERSEHQAFALPGARPHFGPDKVVEVEQIDLHVTPDFETESLDGVCTLTVRALDEPVSRLTLDAVDLEISRVEPSASFSARDGKLEIVFETPIPAGERASVRGDLSGVEAPPRFVLHQTDGRTPGKGRARLDAEPGSVRAVLVPVLRLPAREADARRRRSSFRRACSRWATASWWNGGTRTGARSSAIARTYRTAPT